jgi:hypothetical protein
VSSTSRFRPTPRCMFDQTSSTLPGKKSCTREMILRTDLDGPETATQKFVWPNPFAAYYQAGGSPDAIPRMLCAFANDFENLAAVPSSLAGLRTRRRTTLSGGRREIQSTRYDSTKVPKWLECRSRHFRVIAREKYYRCDSTRTFSILTHTVRTMLGGVASNDSGGLGGRCAHRAQTT